MSSEDVSSKVSPTMKETGLNASVDESSASHDGAEPIEAEPVQSGSGFNYYLVCHLI